MLYDDRWAQLLSIFIPFSGTSRHFETQNPSIPGAGCNNPWFVITQNTARSGAGDGGIMCFKMSVGSRKWNEYIELFVLNYSDLDFRVYVSGLHLRISGLSEERTSSQSINVALQVLDFYFILALRSAMREPSSEHQIWTHTTFLKPTEDQGTLSSRAI